MKDRTITLIQEDGQEIVCDILFTYYAEEFNKNYVVFQVRKTGEVSAATYDPEDGKEGRLGKIETDEEWQLLEDLLSEYAERMGAGCGGNCGGCAGCGSEDCDGNCDCE